VNEHLLRCLPPAESIIVACRRQLCHVILPLVSKLSPEFLNEEVGGFLLLQEATRAGNLDLVKQMISAGAIVNKRRTKDGSTPMFVAAQEGFVDIVRELLNQGGDCNMARLDIGATPLTVAAENGTNLITRYDKSMSNLWRWMVLGHLTVIELLLSRGANKDARLTSDGTTALIWSAQRGHVEVVRALLKAGTLAKQKY